MIGEEDGRLKGMSFFLKVFWNWVWWQLQIHKYTNPIKLYTLNERIASYMNYISMKLFLKRT